MKKTVILAVLLVVCGLGGARAYAQDPAVVNAETVKVTLDNDRVRVLDVVLPPGAKEKLHSHPAYVIYPIDGGKVRSHTPEGKTSEIVFEPGKPVYRDAITHWAENVGGTRIHLVLVEVKK